MASRARKVLDRAASLTWRERRTVVWVWSVLPVIWLMLRVFALPRILQMLDPKGGASRSGDARSGLEEARRAAWLVNGAARASPFRSSCLSRSLVLWRLLRGRGVPAEIRLGVRKRGGALDAHAWVEVNGRAVDGTAEQGGHFAAFSGELPTGR
jgi:hypothetical protein